MVEKCFDRLYSRFIEATVNLTLIVSQFREPGLNRFHLFGFELALSERHIPLLRVVERPLNASSCSWDKHLTNQKAAVSATGTFENEMSDYNILGV